MCAPSIHTGIRLRRPEQLVPPQHRVEVAVHGIAVLHQGLRPRYLAARDRLPNGKRCTNAGGIREEVIRDHSLPVLCQHYLDAHIFVGVVHLQDDILLPSGGIVQSCHLPCEGNRRRNLGAIVGHSPTGIRHLLEHLARIEQLGKPGLGTLCDTATCELSTCRANSLKVLRGTCRKFLDTEELSLPAVDSPIPIAVQPRKQQVHGVVIALCGIEPAGGNYDVTLIAHVITTGMPAGSIACHKRQAHRQQTVHDHLHA